MPFSFLAIDLGTQSLRVSLIDSLGTHLWHWAHPVSSLVDGPVFEQSPKGWADLLEEALSALGRTGLRPDALAVAAPLAGYVAMDASGRPLTHAVMYPDRRTARHVPIVDRAVQSVPSANPYGLRTSIADPLPHFLRLRDESPQIFSQTRRLLDATAWLNWYLTGEYTINAYTALRLHTADVRRSLGVPEGIFGRPTPVGAVIGPLRQDLCEAFSLPSVPVVAATFDSKCAYMGSGIHRAGSSLDISGTVTSFGVVTDAPVEDPEQRIYCVPFGSKFLARGSNASSGGVLEWARKDLLGQDFDTMDAEIAATPATIHGPIFLPFLSGERTPLWNPFATGALLGLTLDKSSRGQIARAVYEGLGFSLRHIVEILSERGAEPEQISLAGGLARNDVLCQIKSNILGKPLVRYESVEFTTIGLCLICGRALGLWSSEKDFSDIFLGIDKTFRPDMSEHDIHNHNFGRYTRFIDALKTTFVDYAEDGA